MAFIKGIHSASEPITKTNHTPKIVSIPLVISFSEKMYHGFVPGIVMRDIICESKEECIEKLTAYVKDYVTSRKHTTLTIPFFPTNEEIKQDFKNIILIKRISTKL